MPGELWGLHAHPEPPVPEHRQRDPWNPPTQVQACIGAGDEEEVRKAVPAPFAAPGGLGAVTQSVTEEDGGGHVRAWGQYLFPVHQEENSANELREEDQAHQDEELEGSGMEESETSPAPRAARSGIPLRPPLPRVPAAPGGRRHISEHHGCEEEG